LTDDGDPRIPREPGETAETGEPVQILADLSLATSPWFLGRVRRRIRRRVLGVQILDLSWFGPVLVVFEYLKVALQFFGRDDRGHGRQE
jgi:hypothetical protein